MRYGSETTANPKPDSAIVCRSRSWALAGWFIARASSHRLPLPGATVRATAAVLGGFTDRLTSLRFPFGMDCYFRGCCSRGGAFCWASCFVSFRAASFPFLPTTFAQVSAFLAVLGWDVSSVFALAAGRSVLLLTGNTPRPSALLRYSLFPLSFAVCVSCCMCRTLPVCWLLTVDTLLHQLPEGRNLHR